MKAFQVLLVALLAAAAADGQSGKCPQPSVQEDVNITKYMGTWYEIKKLPSLFGRGKCNQATYNLLADETVKVHNTELQPNGKINSIEGVAKVKHSSQPAVRGVSFVKAFYSSAKRNDNPIIGVLAQEYFQPGSNSTAYIAASYVKFVESGGARVVPIMINQTLEQYKKLFNSINGVLFPGGSASIISSAYQRAAKIFYDLAIEANKRGDYFPVWGTCLGFEMLTLLTSGERLLSRTKTNSVSLPLNFNNEAKDSRMFKDFPAELMEDLASEPLSVHSHSWSLSVLAHNTNEKLTNFYKVVSTNTDGETEFVSTLEAYDYPIYATQWHPEKNAYEWKKPYIPHTPAAVRSNFYMAEFFVNEARKNFHRFESDEEVTKALIYNYSPTHTWAKGSFVQRYIF